MSTLVTPELEQQAIAWRRHLHAHPELSFEEVETSRYVEETLRSFDGLELERPTPTSVVATLRGSRPGRVLALRADIDALPIQEESGLEFASTRPGVMHACGHDGHTAMLLGRREGALRAARRAGRRDPLRLPARRGEAPGRCAPARRRGRDGRRRARRRRASRVDEGRRQGRLPGRADGRRGRHLLGRDPRARGATRRRRTERSIRSLSPRR